MQIDDLKQNDGINIDATGANESVSTPTRINIGSEQKSKPVQVNISEMVREETINDNLNDPDAKKGMAKDILEGENSPFAEYKRKKVQEMKEWSEEKKLELEMQQEEEISNDKVISNTGALIDDEDEIPVQNDDENYDVIEQDIDEEEDDSLSEIDDELEEAENDQDTDIIEGEPKMKEEKIDHHLDMDLDSVSETTESVTISVLEDDEEEDNDESENEALLHLQKLATERLKPISKSLDISSFTVAKKATAKTSIADKVTKVAKWVLYNQKSTLLMKEFTGSELELLSENSQDPSSLSQLSRRYRMIYDHIASKKPEGFKEWLMSTPYSDIDNYFMGIYVASFDKANYIPIDCTNKKCTNTFLTEDINFMDMVKFKNEEAKKTFKSIYKSEVDAAGSGLYTSEIVPISTNIAIGFKEPSIYALFEQASLDANFKERYSSIMDFYSYIDSVYLIDQESKQLIPIGYKVYPDNPTKTIKSKVKQYANALSNLTIDEFGVIKAYVGAIIKMGNDDIQYMIPEVSCPKCNTTIPERISSAEALVFIRYQLGALVSTSLN